MENSMQNVGSIARSAEVWIFAAFGALVLAACLEGTPRRAVAAGAAGTAPASALALPHTDPAQPMYVVHVVGKRPSAAEKRALRSSAG